MHDTIIIRYGEIALKGKNRHLFEKRLVQNVRACFRREDIPFSKILRKRGRIYVSTEEKNPCLADVFGIVSFSYAVSFRFEIEKAKALVVSIAKNSKADSFRVSAKRIDRTVPENSQKLNMILGQEVADKTGMQVSLKDFGLELGLEIQEGTGYVFSKRLPGQGGLPLGVNGKALALIENRRSVLAAWHTMRRGVAIVPVTRERLDQQRLNRHLRILEKYSYGQGELKTKSLEEEKSRNKMIITGQTLGGIEELGDDILVLRPLVGLSGEEIEKKLKIL